MYSTSTFFADPSAPRRDDTPGLRPEGVNATTGRYVSGEAGYPEISFNESTNFRIKKLMDDEKLLHDEIRFRNTMAKKYGRVSTFTDILEYGLIAGDIVVGTLCAAIPGIGTTISTITFSGVGAISGFAKVLQVKLTAKKTKHRDLALVAKTTLANLTFKISKAISDGQITHDEFEDIQETLKSWKKLRADADSKVDKSALSPELIKSLTEKAQRELIQKLKQQPST